MAFLKFNKAELVNLSYSLKREIICANKTGAYCNTSIVTCNTRRYHGLLGVPVDNFGGSKYMLLSSVDESLSVNGKMFNLGIHCYGEIYEPRGHKYIVDFMADPVPTVVYRVGEMEFVKSILLAPDKDQVMIRYELRRSPAEVELYLKPFLAFRNIHSLTKQNSEARTDYEDIRNGVSFNMYQGFPDLNLQLSNSGFTFKSSPYWYNGITYSDEARRGFDCKEDLFVPGSFTLKMKEGDSIILSASVEEENPRMITRKFNAALKGMKGIGNYHDQLLHCADLLTRDRNGHKMITAGFSWLYTGLLRETMFSLPGFTIATGKLAEFEEILDNIIADNEESYSGKMESGEIVVAGSSTVTPVMEKLKEAYLEKNPGVTIQVQQSDSSTGVSMAIDGTCDIGMASRELKDSETSQGVSATVIAMDGIAVIVNNDCPAEDLSADTVKNIFIGAVKTWSEVLGK